MKDAKIIVRLCGGLGNQMFQYAVGKQLSILNSNAKLLLDNSFYKLGDNRPYELDKLNIKADVATKKEIFDFDNGSLPDVVGKIIELIPWIRVKDFIRRPYSKVYKEKKYKFDSILMKKRGDIYLKGYWSSFKYFESIRHILLEDFKFKNLPNKDNERLINLIISSSSSVSLHVRRGDYLKPDVKKLFYSCTETGYYQRAIKKVQEKIKNPVFFIFSDDPEWVKKNMDFNGDKIFVNINFGETSCWDMYLMSLCKNNIIANSTFSWWGAWLNKNPTKVVCAPKDWTTDNSISLEDLILKQWYLL